MGYFILCLGVFLAAYFLNTMYITVFYHRGLTHGAVKLSAFARKFAVATGSWVTGLDPKGWSTMHRMHHLYSDTPDDPHSPAHQGIFGLALGQLHSYEKTLACLNKGAEPYVSVARDLDFPVNWLNRHKLWILPYALHLGISVAIVALTGKWLLASAYYVGIMSHPVQGWMVNSLAHSFGYRSFNTPDNSRNNTLVAWFVAGEGYQNNHHYRPAAAKFSVKWWEFDPGFILCRFCAWMGWIEILNTESASPKGARVPVTV